MTSPLGLHENGDAIALVSEGEQVTRSALQARATALAERLGDQTINRVLVRSDDPAHVLTALDACHRTGASLWIAHTNVPDDFVEEIRDEFGIELVINDQDEHASPQARSSKDTPSGNASVYMMTSGTTGRPKIAAHTLDSLLGRVRTAASLEVNRGGTWLLTYQTTGFAGVQVLLTGALTHSTIVVPSERTPAKFYSAAVAGSVTHISATPTFWRSFMMVAKPGMLALKQITIGGEAVDQATLDRVKTAFPDARVTHIYASTEAGAVFAVHDGMEGFPAAWLDRPIKGVTLRLRDGFLQIKTPHAMSKYASATAQPHLDDGWIGTADRCEVVGERVRILGRQDSTINVGGSKVYPLAVETVLLGMPEVVEAKVFGVPNPVSGSLVAAQVVLKPGVDAKETRKTILKRCREQLSGYQVPRVFEVVDSIEVGESGKKG